MVPVGNKKHKEIVTIVKIEYFSSATAPLPLDKVKHILGKYTKEVTMDWQIKNKQVLQDTLGIVQAGYYLKDGRKITLRTTAAQRLRSEVLLPEQLRQISADIHLVQQPEGGHVGICVKNIDSLSMAQLLYGAGYAQSFTEAQKKVLVLNFANPVHPGGGARSGSRAQEEDLCRRSSLLPALENAAARAYYTYNAGLGDMGSDAIILTPEVEVIKDEHYELLEQPFTVAVMTCAAPMLFGDVPASQQAAYEALLYRRMQRMFHVAIYYGYTHFVLGAWGCGAFGNDAVLIARLFRKVLQELQVPMANGSATVHDLFRRLDFAVLDRSPEQYNYRAFQKCFADFASGATSAALQATRS